MAASSTNSWLNSSLLSPSAQQQAAQNVLYSSDLQLHAPSHLPHQQVDFGHDRHDPCSSFCRSQDCPRNLDFHDSGLSSLRPPACDLDFNHSPDSQQLQNLCGPARGSSSGGGAGGGVGENAGHHVSARKVHKADREKLRRDRLNEQFVELAGVLDPGRPKNDKATILGDSVQVVRELRSEVKRLRAEQASLLDESRDLAQEKTELREEKSTLKTETERLHVQLQQRLRLMMPWMGMDPSVLMAPPFGYHAQIPQPVSGAVPSAEMHQSLLQGSLPQSGAATPTPIPLPPTGPGPFAIHPALQPYAMLGSRAIDGSNPYLPYLYPQVTAHSHVERPYPQYPSPMQPMPGFLMQVHAHQGQPPISGAPAVTSMYQAFTPGMPLVPPARTQVTQPSLQSRGEADVNSSSPAVYAQPYSGHSSVQSYKKLQPPLPQKAMEPSSGDGKTAALSEPSGQTGRPASELEKENQLPLMDAPTDGVGDSTNCSSNCGVGDSTNGTPPCTKLAGICSPASSASTATRGEAEVSRSQDQPLNSSL